MCLLFIALLGVSGITCLELTKENISKKQENQSALQRCVGVMNNNGLNASGFAQDSVHGIHSLTLEEIRYYFEMNTTEDNRIPVVNLDLASEEPIKFHAPLIGYNKAFKTMAMKVMSYVMQHDRPDYGIQGVNTWEKIGHVYHMHEIYAAAVPIYKKMKDSPPDVSALCPCVNDIVGNGILMKLSKFAQGMRFYATAEKKRKEIKRSKRGADIKKYKKWTGTIPEGDNKKYKKWDNSIPKEFQKRSAENRKYKKWSIEVPIAFQKRSADNKKYKKWSINVPQAFQTRSADNKKYKKWSTGVPKAFQKRSARNKKYKKWSIKVPQAFQKRSADNKKYKKWSIGVPKAFQKRSAGNKKYKKWSIGVPKAFQKRSAGNKKYKKWSIKVPQAFQKRSADNKKYKKWSIGVPKAFQKRSAGNKKYKKWSIKVPQAFQKRSAGNKKYKKWSIGVPQAFQKRSADIKNYNQWTVTIPPFQKREADNKKYKKWSIKVPQAFQKSAADEDASFVNEAEKNYLENTNAETAETLLDAREWVPNSLQGPEQWVSYEAMLISSMPNEQELLNFVTFMFCKLNHPNMDLSESLFN